MVLDGLEGFRDDYEEHILHHRCFGGLAAGALRGPVSRPAWTYPAIWP